MAKIIVYTAVPCWYCSNAIRYLKEIKKQSQIEVIDLTGKLSERQELARRTGQRTVPQIFINDTHIGGYDDMRALDRSGGLDPLLSDN